MNGMKRQWTIPAAAVAALLCTAGWTATPVLAQDASQQSGNPPAGWSPSQGWGSSNGPAPAPSAPTDNSPAPVAAPPEVAPYNPPPVESVPPEQNDYSRNWFIHRGAILPITLGSTVSSSGSYVGQHVVARIDANAGEDENLPRGSKILGRVTEVDPKQDGSAGAVYLTFDRLVTPDGSSYPIHTIVMSAEGNNVNVDSDGRLVARSDSSENSQRDAAIGAAVGGLGSILFGGGRHFLGSAIIGGAAGYGISSIDRAQNGAQDFTLNPGTGLELRVTAPVRSDRDY
jgi:hypothetical protein